MTMISEIEDYFARGCGRCARFDTADCASRIWSGGLADLRRLCLAAGLTETVKWGHPCYTHAGRNVAIIGALRGDFRLIFFEAALLSDPDGVLERQGPNTRHPDMIRFQGAGEVAARAPQVTACLVEAMDHAAAGRRAPKAPQDDDLPAELSEALASDPELAEAFDRLTPGRRRSYLINLNGAKRAETRIARIAGFRPRILAGKGALER
jgi:uncharacterized protein YdeI (YjbR/CyaY-like superfamily)